MPVFKPHYSLYTLIAFLLPLHINAQEAVWTLQDCQQYAKTHNLSIKESDIDLRLAELNYRVSKLSHIPQLSLSSSYGGSYGRSINPTTNEFENTQFSSLGLSVSSGILLFGWFQKHYTVKNSRLRTAQAEQVKLQRGNEVAIQVATAYLRALLAKEQIANVAAQVALSREHKSRMEGLLEGGRSNVLEVAQARAQLAADSGLYYRSTLGYEQALIALKAILNLDFKVKITPVPPADYAAPFYAEPVDPEILYVQAAASYPDILHAGIGMNIAKGGLKIARAASLPQFSTYFSSGSNYSSSFYETLPNGERRLMHLGRQLNNNLSQSFGLSVSVPLFNGFAYRRTIRNAGYDLERAALAQLNARQRLQQLIYTAYTDYEIALKQYFAAETMVEQAERAFRAAAVRFEHGLIAHIEYLTEKNNFLEAQNAATACKYELQFKKIILDSYRDGGGE